MVWGWLGPLLVAVFGGVLRFVDLGRPRAVVFDETYYAKDAWALIHYGVERASLGTVGRPGRRPHDHRGEHRLPGQVHAAGGRSLPALRGPPAAGQVDGRRG
ncbi:hypothetical protein GCM10018952_60500 [Streptosporangium vulgare]